MHTDPVLSLDLALSEDLLVSGSAECSTKRSGSCSLSAPGILPFVDNKYKNLAVVDLVRREIVGGASQLSKHA